MAQPTQVVMAFDPEFNKPRMIDCRLGVLSDLMKTYRDQGARITWLEMDTKKGVARFGLLWRKNEQNAT